ncbi:precorrin-8X methylmutase [Tropicimonas omnivorans]|uniref:precorrin-8X methylmutase n=1 Tax=Tropicimonas omnivorans TaxID=3075590 RepID=UPI003D76D6F6
MAGRFDTDPATIRAKSFSAIRSEARLDRFGADMQAVVVRLIEACGMAEVADRLAFSGGAATRGRAAMTDLAPVFCDCEMVAAGISAGVATARVRTGIAPDRLGGAVVAIGSDPVALFKLLESLDAGAPRPAVILAFPAGFVGAAESKAELAARPRGCNFITLRGRRGGAAMAAAAVIAMGRGLDG